MRKLGKNGGSKTLLNKSKTLLQEAGLYYTRTTPSQAVLRLQRALSVQ